MFTYNLLVRYKESNIFYCLLTIFEVQEVHKILVLLLSNFRKNISFRIQNVDRFQEICDACINFLRCCI